MIEAPLKILSNCNNYNQHRELYLLGEEVSLICMSRVVCWWNLCIADEIAIKSTHWGNISLTTQLQFQNIFYNCNKLVKHYYIISFFTFRVAKQFSSRLFQTHFMQRRKKKTFIFIVQKFEFICSVVSFNIMKKNLDVHL